MKLAITESALERLQAVGANRYANLLLWYDIEGCGCGVNGVNRILFTNDMKDTYKKVDNNSDFCVWVPEQQMIFFAEEMTLERRGGLLRLKSASEMLNAFISPQSLLDFPEQIKS
ncbi:iron-sulfur cluster biosynthesis family protein [Virgibacillus sp. 179-BFC.A HS]|uniref:Iron-sulfur cluster biosynthesis family protein n=1 Tax=Tigheibacillus jepli TaxID=3035914 RepID=A0ABU5CI43_9BACI|nr:iron-sulfur cluster biosynthesis family protein [Virgibacillus sp. 179-BFC.A HS]MDY0405641.1 iron-sulfur cluster biosynthesis family protein [Virgibacillus sp. 179-BFC.A HS]